MHEGKIKMPVLFTEKENCCGCSACFAICTKQAIQMKEDFAGYLYPEINTDLCIECNLCEKVCPLKHEVTNDEFVKKVFGVKNKNTDERMRSSSGSVFIEAAKYVLGQRGIVYGVKMLPDLKVEFGRARTLEEARAFQGSKYVQSIKGESYKNVKEDLQKGKTVLFTGTPCEVAGLKKYLGKAYDNLYAIDIICHGVPSQQLLYKCIKEQEVRHKSKLKEMIFRDKKYGWRHQEISMVFENDKNYHSPIWEDEFYRLFTGNYILRDSCYSCRYSNMNRVGDITIGDFWNINNVDETFEDFLGVSSVLVNTEKGEYLFNQILNKFDGFECSLEDVKQQNLVRPSLKPEDYDSFQNDLKEKGMSYSMKKYGSMGKLEKIRRFVSPLKKKVMKIISK